MARQLVNGIGALLGRLADFALPDACQLCGDPVRGLPACPGCLADLPRIRVGCSLCARPLPAPGTCGRCLARPPPWSAAVVPFAWAFPLDRLVGRLKYGGALAHARLLGGLLAEAVAGRPVDVVVPVPLHASRLAERGFNQALEIARPVARRLGVPLNAAGVRRRRATPPQAGLPARARRRNLRGAFAADVRFEDRVVALVDDVLTTGATAGELSRVIAGAGASRVEVWAVARAGGRAQAPRNV